MDEAHKKELNISRLKYNEVIYEATFKGPPRYLKHILWTFLGVLIIIKCSLQIDLIMPKPHNIKFIFIAGHCGQVISASDC